MAFESISWPFIFFLTHQNLILPTMSQNYSIEICWEKFSPIKSRVKCDLIRDRTFSMTLTHTPCGRELTYASLHVSQAKFDKCSFLG
jgi:hypothetical protein